MKKEKYHTVGLWLMVLNATFNNISAISWRSVLLVEETGVPGENHSHCPTVKYKNRRKEQNLYAKYIRIVKLHILILVFIAQQDQFRWRQLSYN